MKIYRSKKTNSFIIDDEYFQIGLYEVFKENNKVSIKQMELGTYLIWQLPHTEIHKEDGSSFTDLDTCVDYIKTTIGEPVVLNAFQEQVNIEKDLYKKRIQDGKDMSMGLMAELRVNSQLNGLPRDVNKHIEEKLDKVKINIDRGWWVTALEELETVTISTFFTQALYDRIHNTIFTYIQENY